MERNRKILIIYPHWVPSNLAGVHRPRLVANYLKYFGWQPILLTVDPLYYEEKSDPDIAKTVSKDIEVHYVKAKPVTKPRILGDIGLRAWPYIKKKALQLIQDEKPDFLWIPIPSFYTALMGRVLHEKTGIPYGIDYIDPWVRDISNRKNIRSRLSILTARLLEPYAVRKATLISGVNENYYLPVYNRNFSKGGPADIAFPYGFDPNDHQIQLENISYPWDEIPDVQPLVYAGAFLPNSHLFIKALFKVIKQMKEKGNWNKRKQLFFLGTGNYTGTTIGSYAKEFGIDDLVHERKERYPFLHILNYLSSAYAVMIIGSTEKHYTASKTFQSLLSKKPVFGILHQESSAAAIMKECRADNFLVRYNEKKNLSGLEVQISDKLNALIRENNSWEPYLGSLAKYSSKASAKAFAEKLDEIL
jgi:hypothetical protein